MYESTLPPISMTTAQVIEWVREQALIRTQNGQIQMPRCADEYLADEVERLQAELAKAVKKAEQWEADWYRLKAVIQHENW